MVGWEDEFKTKPGTAKLLRLYRKSVRANHRTPLVKQTRRVLGFGYTVYLYSIFLGRRYVERAQLVEEPLGVMFE
jgi:hypothetical protein